MNYPKIIIKMYPFGKNTGSLSLLLTLFLTIFGTASGLFAQAYTSQSDTDNVLHQERKTYRLSYTGDYRDFTIPASAAGKYLYLNAQGGDGGAITYKKDLGPGRGGQGATVSGAFKIGSGANEIPVGATLRVIVAQAGASYQNDGQSGHHCGGGGGGTGILFLPPDFSPDYVDRKEWVMLMVAGGGGGGFAKWGRESKDGLPGNASIEGTGENNKADIVPNESLSDVFSNCGKDNTDFPGLAGTSGGGTYYKLRSEMCDDSDDDKHTVGDSNYDGGGFGGFQRLYDGRILPIGHKGGDTGKNDNNGGFGFGSGGAGLDSKPGGGGGFAGGGAGYFGPVNNFPAILLNNIPAGGGGSYLNAEYALPSSGVKIKNGTTRNSEDGFVQYRFLDTFDLPSVTKDRQYTNTRSKSLLSYGDYTLRWQKDGNLVLYHGEINAANAQWATGTEGRGKIMFFQNDGNLVIYDANNNAIWATATADAQQDDKGGVSLTLNPFGQLAIQNIDMESVWSVN